MYERDAATEQAVLDCFRNAGTRLVAGKPFCHPGDCTHPNGKYCEGEMVLPNGVWVVGGLKIPMHVVYKLCAEHAPA